MPAGPAAADCRCQDHAVGANAAAARSPDDVNAPIVAGLVVDGLVMQNSTGIAACRAVERGRSSR